MTSKYLPTDYSIDEIRAMQPGATLDWLCMQLDPARQTFMERSPIHGGCWALTFCDTGKTAFWIDDRDRPGNVSYYSTDWSYAGPLLEEMEKLGLLPSLGASESGGWCVYLHRHGIEGHAHEAFCISGDTPMTAIARAFVIQHIMKMEARK